MFNKFQYNQKLYNYSLAIENIIYSEVDTLNGNLNIGFKYKFNINSEVDNFNSNLSTYLIGGAIISQLDEPSGNLVFNYKYNFNINSQIDNIISSLDFSPSSDVLDLTKNEILYTISGADTFLGTPDVTGRTLGGLPSYNRISSFLPLRLFPVESLNLFFVSGNHIEENIDIKLEINDSSSIYTASYKDSESNNYGDPVVVDFENEMKLFNETGEKYIYIKLTEAPLIEKNEVVQLKSVFNNELLLNEFDKNLSDTFYSSFFIINESEYNMENIKIYTDYNEKIITEVGVEEPVNREIQTISNNTTAPIGVTFSEIYDNTGSNIIEIIPAGGFYGVWTKHYLRDDTSTNVSPIEYINLNIEYTKDTTSPYTDSIKTLTRIYDDNLSNKLKLYYNINNTIDSTSVNTVILDGTGDLPYNFYDTSSLVNGDIIYYDIVRLNKYGIESVKNLNNYSIYNDTSGSLLQAPLPPANGNLLYDTSGNIMFNVQYFPEMEPDIINRAYYWNIEFYKINDSTSNLLISDTNPMDVTSGVSNDLENFNYIIDNTSIDLLDKTPIVFKTYTENDSFRSLTSFDYTGEYFDRDTITAHGNVNIFYGNNFGINRKIVSNKNQIININSNIDYVIDDNKVLLKYLNIPIIKVIYRGETNLKNTFYLRSDYTIVEDDSLFTDSLITDIFEPFEVVGNILYFLVNLKRCMAIDLNNKILYVNSITHDAGINLNDKYKNEYLFKRYDETIFNIYSNTEQKFIPFMYLNDSGDLYNNFNFNNTKINLNGVL